MQSKVVAYRTVPGIMAGIGAGACASFDEESSDLVVVTATK